MWRISFRWVLLKALLEVAVAVAGEIEIRPFQSSLLLLFSFVAHLSLLTGKPGWKQHRSSRTGRLQSSVPEAWFNSHDVGKRRSLT